MKAMISLWRNECVKIMRQTASKVIIVIVLVLAVLLSILVVGMYSDYSTYYYSEEYWESEAEQALEDENYFWYADSLARLDSMRFFRDRSISAENWKYIMYIDTYTDLLSRKNYDKLYLDGKIPKEEFAGLWQYEDTVYDSTQEDGEADGTYADKNDDSSWIETFDAAADLAETEKKISEIENQISTMSVKTFAQENLVTLREELKMHKSELADTKSLLEKGDASAAQVETASLTVEGTEYMISFWESIVDTTLGAQDEDWLINAVQGAGDDARSALIGTVPVSEEEFNSDPSYASTFSVSDYGEYCRKLEKHRANAYRALMTVGYALENEISIPDVTQNSTKSLVWNALSLEASLVVLAMVILTANCIANEYSAGTIRLLVIRPRRRTSIIMSKFLALLTVGAVLCAVTFLIVNAVCVISNGVGDFFVPDLMYSDGVIEINPVIYSMGKMLLPVVSGMLMISLAFMMSVVTRRAALAIVIPLAADVFASVLQFMAIGYSDTYPILRYTVLPYLDLSPYLSSPVSQYASYSSGGFMDLFIGGVSRTLAASDLSALTGAAVIALHILVMFGVGFEVFRRQQIKN